MGTNLNAADSRWLRDAWENRTPVIYFLGIAPGLYHAILPVFISDWNPVALNARIVFGATDEKALYPPQDAAERRYALRSVKQRLHQASFRETVLTAYDGRWALPGLPEPRLLDAAHIIRDQDAALGRPIVTNGLPLSKIHHTAFRSQ